MYEHFPVLKQRHTQQAGTLSGGEQQMLAVARALMLRPRLMLLDEPSFGLAPLIVRDLFKILGKINREDKVTILVVEQNAQLALETRRPGLRDRDRPHRDVRRRPRDRQQRRRPQILSRLLGSAAMELFTNQILAGIATGAIYACMALAVVMIYQAIDHLNFAQGEMAMFSTFIAWQLMQWGVPYWGAFLLTLAFSFCRRHRDRAAAVQAAGQGADPDQRRRLHRAVLDHQQRAPA